MMMMMYRRGNLSSHSLTHSLLYYLSLLSPLSLSLSLSLVESTTTNPFSPHTLCTLLIRLSERANDRRRSASSRFFPDKNETSRTARECELLLLHSRHSRQVRVRERERAERAFVAALRGELARAVVDSSPFLSLSSLSR